MADSAQHERLPELERVGEALDQLRHGEAVTAPCFKCGKPLVAEVIEATGALVIICRAGHTYFRVGHQRS